MVQFSHFGLPFHIHKRAGWPREPRGQLSHRGHPTLWSWYSQVRMSNLLKASFLKLGMAAIIPGRLKQEDCCQFQASLRLYIEILFQNNHPKRSSYWVFLRRRTILRKHQPGMKRESPAVGGCSGVELCNGISRVREDIFYLHCPKWWPQNTQLLSHM